MLADLMYAESTRLGAAAFGPSRQVLDSRSLTMATSVKNWLSRLGSPASQASVLLAGFLAPVVGLEPAAYVFGMAVILMALASLFAVAPLSRNQQ